MSAWPRVPLGDAVRYRKEFITIDDAETYKLCRVQLHAKGVVLRQRMKGADIGTKKQQVCRAGDFLVAEIDAKVGGFGLVPPELEGAIVSSHYFLFESNEAQLDRKFLDYFSRTEDFRAQVSAQGSTNYAAIRPCHLLGYKIPLPPVPEQQAIVARLDALADRTRQLTAHLDAIESDADRLLALRFRDTIVDAPYRPMAQIAPLVRREAEIDPQAKYTELGVRSFYKGTFQRRTVLGSEFTWQKMFRVERDDLIFSNIMAWEQAIALAKPEDHGSVGNHRMLTCVADPALALSVFLAYYFTTEEGFAKVYAASPGTAARNRTLVAGNLHAIEVPVPPLAEQQMFVELQFAVTALKSRHAALRESNAALLPAMLERLFSKEGD